jgi:hypothetical protein
VNEKQFEWLLRNKRKYQAQPLMSRATADELVKSATKAVGRKSRGEDAWSAAVPAFLAKEAEVLGLRNGVLVVLVQNPAVRHTLQQQSSDLVRRMREVLPAVKGLRLVGKR